MIIALAGRRIDAPGASVARFPADRAGGVREALRARFEAYGATALVASGACGADLVAHEAAGALGLRRRLVLPFAPARFRATSVTDRADPESWGRRFDALVEAVAPDDLVVLPARGDEQAAYAAVNDAILDHALRLAGPAGTVRAVVVWEGRSRGEGDLTEAFAAAARARGIGVDEVRTR